MALLEIRQRTGWLFVAVVVAHVLLISAQAKTGRGVPMLEAVVFGVFAEVNRAAAAAVGAVRGTWQDYVDVQEIRRQNETLRDDLARLQIALQRERTAAERARSLQALLGLREEVAQATVAARVIGGSASPEFRTITIDKGTDDGVRPDMAVISPAGVVGRVVQPSTRAAKVQLLIDSDAAAGGLVERSRAQGVVVGTKAGTGLRLDHVNGSADIQVGDRVVTSGIEGIFPPAIDGEYPRGFVIGHIESIDRTSAGYRSIAVRPAVDFSSLEDVLVVLDRPSDVVFDTAHAERGPRDEVR
jgi:rod shape-determining protein MreC